MTATTYEEPPDHN